MGKFFISLILTFLLFVFGIIFFGALLKTLFNDQAYSDVTLITHSLLVTILFVNIYLGVLILTKLYKKQ